jgi:hypothetical protein
MWRYYATPAAAAAQSEKGGDAVHFKAKSLITAAACHRCCRATAAAALPLMLLKFQNVMMQCKSALMLLATADSALPLLLLKVQNLVIQFTSNSSPLSLLLLATAAAALPLLLLKVQNLVTQFTWKCVPDAPPLLLLKVQNVVMQFTLD